MKMETKRDDNKFWFGFFLGGLLGAIVLFFAGTKEGKKAGHLLQRKGKELGDDLVDELQERLEQLKAKGKELARDGEELKQEIAEKLVDKKDEFTKDISEKIDTTLSHIEAIQERGRQATAEMRKGLFKNIPKKS